MKSDYRNQAAIASRRAAEQAEPTDDAAIYYRSQYG